jgi:hypothetical protein
VCVIFPDGEKKKETFKREIPKDFFFSTIVCTYCLVVCFWLLTFSLFFPINDFYIEELLLWVFPLCWRPSPSIIQRGGERSISRFVIPLTLTLLVIIILFFFFLLDGEEMIHWTWCSPFFFCSLIERIAHRRRPPAPQLSITCYTYVVVGCRSLSFHFPNTWNSKKRNESSCDDTQL